MKKLHLDILDEEDISEMGLFIKEIEHMKKLKHPNLLGFIGACLELHNIMLVTDYMAK